MSGATPIGRQEASHLDGGGGPTMLALRHLRRRRIAVVCFGVLTLYFVLAVASYLPWIGPRFESFATRQLVSERGISLEYMPPTLGRPDLSTLPDLELGPDDVAYWAEIDAERNPGLRAERHPASSVHFLLGTEVNGRSVLWRMLYGARMSITIALGASLLAIVIGTTLGALAGYLGGIVDVVITWLFTTVASIPRILLVLAMAYSLRGYATALEIGWVTIDPAVPMLIAAMGLTSWVSLCRLVRGEILKQRAMDYESAARAIGLSRRRILMRHLLPNAMYLIIIQFSLLFPLFIHLEVILSYLGLGADTGVSWGRMIQDSLQEMMRTPIVWWQLAAATLAVFGISLALNLFGDALRDALDPKLQKSTT